MSDRYTVEITLHWLGVACYIVGAVGLTARVVFGMERARRVGLVAAAAGLLPHGAAILLRWVAVGHGPYLLRYEVLSSNAWVAVAALVLVLARRPAWTAVAVVAMPLAILAMAFGMFSNPETRELPPTLRSTWLTFHIIFAKVSAAAFLVSLGSAVLVLLNQRPVPPAWLRRAPPVATLDALVLRSAGFGFIFWSVTIAAGAIWANQSWGRYWGWDPIETWALVSWVTWGSFLHLRLFFKLRPVPTAWLSVAAFVIFILALLILPFFINSLHSAYYS
jgi:cytochrome c-type biogenesis protein CcsB